MAFITVDTKQISFECIEGMLKYVEQEKKNTARISIGDLLEEGVEFSQDAYFGKADYQFKFNQPALDGLCRMLNLYSPMLKQLEKPGLASDVLNDRIQSKAKKSKEKLHKTQFVFDEPSKTVLGIVSDSYVGYSNQDFLEDVSNCLTGDKQKSLLPSFGEFDFTTSYSINTHLNIRLKSRKEIGIVQGKGGTGEDVSILGLQISNSMAGGKALRMAYFIERLVCANGLILPVGGSDARLIHAGHRANFNKRLNNKMRNVIGSLGTAKKVIEKLGKISFSPEKIALHADLKALFGIIPDKDLKQLATDKMTVDFKDWLSTYDKKEREFKKNVELISLIPQVIGGKHSHKVFDSHWRDNASIFDFINVFTEEAHDYPPQKRLQIENNTGELADFIAKKKKKFA